VPYVLVGRCEKRRLAQFKDNLRISSVYDVPVKRRDVRSPEALHDLNIRKRICELRKEGKKNL
jgi:hypothetical protein